MPHRIAHVLEVVIAAGSTLLLATSTAAVASEAPTAASLNELLFFLLPFIGGVIVAGCMIMLNPNPDTRKIVIGRAGLALFCGTLLPQIIGLFHPGLMQMSIKPPVLVLTGGFIAGLVYVLSKAFTRGLYERAEGVAARELDRLEGRYSPPASDHRKPSDS